MSYCSKPGIDLWPSKPTYGALRAAIHARFDPQAPVAAGPPATYLVVRGSYDAASGDVTLDGVAKIEGLQSPGNPPTGAFTLRLRDGSGGLLGSVPFATEPCFGLSVPQEIRGVPSALFDVRAGWREPDRYDEQALLLARRFDENFAQYRDHVSDDVVRAGPRVGSR